jgi:dihydroorotase
MKVLLQNARIICPGHPFHEQKRDFLITDGFISRISESITESADEVISHDNLHVSLGWMDIFAHFNDPGNEYREDLISGTNAARVGGFTDVMAAPNTHPAVSSRTQVEYFIKRSASLPVAIHPIACVSRDHSGKELAEMYDLKDSGAAAFSDGLYPVQDPGMLLKALQYIIPINGTLIQIPINKSIQSSGLMHEGIMSTKLGLPGKPAMAEEMMIARDIDLVRYTGSRLHFTGVSTAAGLQLIIRARAEGLHVTCSVTPYHCHFCDEDLNSYDTNLKTDPPLRSRSDMMALQNALREGIIDGIASHHFPLHSDEKLCEFENALPGMAGLESVFGAMNLLFEKTEDLISLLTVSNRRIFGIPLPELKEGAPARLTLFDPDAEYTLTKEMIRSRSGNNAFMGRKLKGLPLGTILNEKVNTGTL